MLIGATHAPPVDTLAPMKVTALPRDESISLFATVAGMSAVDKDAQDSILAAICELLADVPLAIVTAARVASTNKLSPEQARATLESVKPPSSDPEQAGIERAYGLAYSTLSENERRLLQTIAVLPGVSVDPDLLARLISGKVSAQSLTPGIVVKDGYVIVGGARLRVRDYAQPPAGETGTTRPPVDAEWVAAAIERLKSIGLLHENSPRLRIDPGLRGLARLGVDEAAIQDQLLTQMLYDVMRNKTRDPEYCDDELGSILGAIDWAATQHRQADVIALCRSIDSHLMQNGLWDAWGKVADRGLQAARANGDRFNEAWALHQLGTRSLGLSRID